MKLTLLTILIAISVFSCCPRFSQVLPATSDTVFTIQHDTVFYPVEGELFEFEEMPEDETSVQSTKANPGAVLTNSGRTIFVHTPGKEIKVPCPPDSIITITKTVPYNDTDKERKLERKVSFWQGWAWAGWILLFIGLCLTILKPFKK